jgi:hypothetical protein
MAPPLTWRRLHDVLGAGIRLWLFGLAGPSPPAADRFRVDFARRDLSGKIAHSTGPQGRNSAGRWAAMQEIADWLTRLGLPETPAHLRRTASTSRSFPILPIRSRRGLRRSQRNTVKICHIRWCDDAGRGLDRDSPDDSRAEVNICAFPTFPQDRRELRTAAGTWGGRNGGRRIELVILPGIWTYSSRRLLWNG